MINNVKSTFVIRDMENLSGVKAHTIRIWEQRYKLFTPLRTDSNVRVYDLESFQKLLNVSLLLKYGLKISRISRMTGDEIDVLVREIRSLKFDRSHISHQFKVAMMTFDEQLFLTTYDSLLKDRNFSEIFFQYFMPLLEDIGLLWQTRTINPAHEHFISNLIRLKIQSNSNALIRKAPSLAQDAYVLFLPQGEIHELGLLYLHYELRTRGKHTIYLGENLPVSSLEGFKFLFKKVIYVCYATIVPAPEHLPAFLKEINDRVLGDNGELWLLGASVSGAGYNGNCRAKFFPSLEAALNNL